MSYLRWLLSLRTALLACSLLSFAASADTVIQLRSDPGDYIGGGTNRTLSPAGGTITASPNYDSGVTVTYSANNGTYSYWRFNFSGPKNSVLVADNYEDATRLSFRSPTKPGLDVSGDGRGCNKLTGRFVVREAVYGPAGDVQKFAVDFEQHCEGGVPALWGTLRYNSDIPLVVPTPNAAAGADKHVIESTDVQLDGGKSSDGDGTIVGYQWRQVSGPPTTLASPTSPKTTFVAPSVNLGGQDLVFELEVRDDAGLTDTDLVTIHVANRYDPQYMIYFSSTPGDYIGQGRTWNMGTDDGVFTATKNYDNGVTVQFQGEAWWNLNFSAPGDVPLTVGTYEGTARWPFQSAGQPGLDISGDGRGCNTSTGRFVIHDISYGSGNTIDRFAADFEQHCEGSSAPLYGTVRFNYRLPMPKADLSASLSASSKRVKYRRPFSYTAIVSNQGPDSATNASLVLRLPQSVTFYSAPQGCTYSSQVVTCAIGTVASGVQINRTITVVPKDKGQISATAEVSANETDPDTSNNSASVTVTVVKD